MPNQLDAEDLSVSDIGVDSILDAAGLGEDDVSPTQADADDQSAGGISLLTNDLEIGHESAYGEVDQPVLDEDEFAFAFDDNSLLVPESIDDGAELSGVDSGFFAGTFEEDIWEVPGDRSKALSPASIGLDTTEQNPVLATSGAAAPSVDAMHPRLSQLPHFELDLPAESIDEGAQTVFAAQTESGVPDVRAGIVQKKRAQRSKKGDDFKRESSTKRAVLIRPDDQFGVAVSLDAPKDGGQVIARTRIVSKVICRRNAPDKPSKVEAAIPERTPIPAGFVGEGVADDTTPETEEEVTAWNTGDFAKADGTPDEVWVERPTGAAALVAWMSKGEES